MREVAGQTLALAAGLFETGSCAGFGGEPLVEGGLALDDEESLRHLRVAIAAELRTINLETPFLRWPKPNRDSHSGNGILRDTQGDHFEGMNDVLGGDINNHGL